MSRSGDSLPTFVAGKPFHLLPVESLSRCSHAEGCQYLSLHHATTRFSWLPSCHTSCLLEEQSCCDSACCSHCCYHLLVTASPTTTASALRSGGGCRSVVQAQRWSTGG